MKRKLLNFSILTLFILLLSAGKAFALDKDSYFWFLEAEALGGYSELSGVSSTGSTLDKWTFSPNLKLSENTYWLNVYYGTFDRSSQVTSQDEGPSKAQTNMSHSLSTAIKHNFNPNWSVRPLFFCGLGFVEQTADESLGNGLYDYRDIGGGLESTWTVLRAAHRQNDFRIGLRIFDRVYPNYTSLLTAIGGSQENEKDFTGYKVNISFDSTSIPDWSWGLESITLYKDYTDKTIDLNGIRQGDTREDIVQYFNINATHSINNQWRLRLDGQYSFNFSNLDFYDTFNTIGLGDDHFEKDYYDYHSLSFKPSLIYTKTIDKDKLFSAQAAYIFNAVYYIDRHIQSQNGTYLSERERDYTHTLTAKVSYPLTKQLSWVSQASYTTANSNQDFERFYLYSYDLWSILSGVSFKY